MISLYLQFDEHKVCDILSRLHFHSHLHCGEREGEPFHFSRCRQGSCDETQMAAKIKALRSKIDEREKLRTGYGVWWVTHDDNDICYGVCTDETYPERHAFGLIQKLKEKVR